MAAISFGFCLILLFLNFVHNYSLNVKLPEINETDFDSRSHFKYEIVLKVCNNRDEVCSSNNTSVCAMRKSKNDTQYKDYKNICYLFMSNMCDYPGEEFYVIRSGTCDDYISRRNEGDTQDDEQLVENIESANSSEIDITPDILRVKKTTPFVLLTAYDDHICPLSCPDIYSPECLNVNRGYGKYYKMFTFVNHCVGDQYYCKHWQEFSPPPGKLEDVQPSALAWSHCSSARYLQFASFSETASSLGHYGWLAGDHRYKHIMEPNQRVPGYG